MIHLIEFGFAAIVLYTGLCLVHPVHRCPRCKGTAVVPKGNGFAPCRKCKGSRRARRFGAARIQRLAWDYAAPWVRQRFRGCAERMREDQP